MNNLPKVVAQQRRDRASNPRLLDRKFDALPLSHRTTVSKNVPFSELSLVGLTLDLVDLSLSFSATTTLVGSPKCVEWDVKPYYAVL